MREVSKTDYFKRRGLTAATIKKFCLGYDEYRQTVTIPYSSKKLLKKWHFYKAHALNSMEGDELTKKINAIEKAIASIEDVDQTIIRLKYFQGLEVDTVKSNVFLSRSVVYWRIDRAVNEMSYIIANTFKS